MGKNKSELLLSLLVSLIFVCLLAPFTNAQLTADISGQVLLNGIEAVSNAEIYYYNPILDVDTTVYTDIEGYYCIPGMPLPVEESDNYPVYKIESGVLNSVGSASAVYFLDTNPVENVSVYNILGRQVTPIKMSHTRLSNGLWMSTGFWNGRSAVGSHVSNGRYFITANINGNLNTVPVIHLREGHNLSAPSYAKVKDDINRNNTYKDQRLINNNNEIVVFDVSIRPTGESMTFVERNFRRTIHDGLNDVFIDTVYLANEIDQILFIGNSYTASNGGLGHKLAEMVNYAHPEWNFVVGHETYGGYTLLDHAGNVNTQSAIIEGEWDYVVLQEQSYRPVSDPELMRDGAIALDNLITSTGAETALFMTWAYQDDPEMIDPLSTAYTSIGEELDALVAPVGLAWENAFELDPDLVLHITDGSHPNIKGTYLAVCVFYSAIFNENPEGNNFISEELISIEMQEFLQQVAWQTVQDYFSSE